LKEKERKKERKKEREKKTKKEREKRNKQTNKEERKNNRCQKETCQVSNVFIIDLKSGLQRRPQMAKTFLLIEL
jgi:hypothetical protein